MLSLAKKYFFLGKSLADKVLAFMRVRYLEIAIVAAIFIPIGGYAGWEAGMWMVADEEFCGACHVHDYANEAWEKSIHGQPDITCHDCHHQSLFANVKSAVYLMTPGIDQTKLIHSIPVVKDPVCMNCHSLTKGNHDAVLMDMDEDRFNKIPKVTENRLHKIHLESKSRDPFKKLDWNIPAEDGKDFSNSFSKGNLLPIGHTETAVIHCRDCHGSKSNRAHNFAPVRDNCEQCHNGIKEKDEIHSHSHNRNCLVCHAEGFLTDVK